MCHVTLNVEFKAIKHAEQNTCSTLLQSMASVIINVFHIIIQFIVNVKEDNEICLKQEGHLYGIK